jgi:hypothetical protein
MNNIACKKLLLSQIKNADSFRHKDRSKMSRVA